MIRRKHLHRKVIFIDKIVRLLSYNQVPQAPPDKILGLNEEFKADKAINKVNLTVGAYRDDDGQPVLLESVRKAEKQIFHRKVDHEYAGIAGIPNFIQKSLEFAYGSQSPLFAQKRIAAIQALSGTGACRVAAEFISTYFKNSHVYLPDPTWPNHINIFHEAGITPKYYPYYDYHTKTFHFDAMKEFIASSPPKSWFLIHSCAHNPTGYDPSKQEWSELSDVLHKNSHHVIFDCAYQGFASGDADRDAYSIRLFVERGHHIILSQSFAKNFGLYGERVGTLSVVTASSSETEAINSQLKRLARAMYSNPPIYGARLVAEILSDNDLKKLWETECKTMADRIISMRYLLVSKLNEAGSKRDWSHIINQIGMFSFLGLTKDQVLILRREYNIYCTEDSRISIAGITTKNVEYVANAIHHITS